MVAQITRELARTGPRNVWQRLLAWGLFEGRPLTTRGRWINPLVLGLHRIWHALPIEGGPDRPIFIVGTGRSGTTLLARIIGVHPQVGMLNEPKALWHTALGCDDLIGSYSNRPGRYRMGAENAGPVAVKRLSRSYSAFCRLAGARRIVDKYPELAFRIGFLRQAFPDARFVAIQRDPWQTAASVRAWSAKHGDGQSDWWGKEDRKWNALVQQVVLADEYPALTAAELEVLDQADRAAVEWLATERELRRWRHEAPAALHFVSFEELASEPRRVLGDLLRFCGLPDDQRMMSYALKSIAPPHLYPRPRLHPAIEAALKEGGTEAAA